VFGDARPTQPNLDLFLLDDRFDGLSDMPIRHAISNRIDVNKTVCTDATFQSASANGQGARRHGPQGRSLVTLEAISRPLPGRSVDPSIRNFNLPRCQVTLQVSERTERSSGQGIVLDVADHTFDLPFGLGRQLHLISANQVKPS
jgi:hypothetical protein